MYSPSYFRENDPAVVMDFVKQNPFGLLCGCDANNRPVATQIPFLIKEKEGKPVLYGHIMRKTDHHLALEQNPNVLVVFTGAHTYVSASWYTHQQVASTWNYMTVQAKGILHFLDKDGLFDLLKRTTAHFENNPDSPALYEKMPEDYIASLSKAIIGFEIEVSELNNTFKLSQNRDADSYKNIIHKLRGQASPDAESIAKEMEKRAKLK
ncbi:MAG: FMN-binding negative transcriptional regulator [Chitinophagaceae bacterium]|nr:FMN-binding negative transcriptional regulator [Chitinophagaceae bacterium]